VKIDAFDTLYYIKTLKLRYPLLRWLARYGGKYPLRGWVLVWEVVGGWGRVGSRGWIRLTLVNF
jgi:hypothetical protein